MTTIKQKTKKQKGFQQKQHGLHHYYLAHFALREFCQKYPELIFFSMASQTGDYFLQCIWQQVQKVCDHEGKQNLDMPDIKITRCQIGDSPAIIFTLPPPERLAEAYFIGVLFKESETKSIRYFTLEMGEKSDGSLRTVLGEWAGECHKNMGTGPAATLKDFARAIEKNS